MQEPTKSCLVRTEDAPITQGMPKNLGALCKMLQSPVLLRKLKGVRRPVSGTGVKDQMLEQKILLASLSLRRSQRLQELCVRNRGQRPVYMLLTISQTVSLLFLLVGTIISILNTIINISHCWQSLLLLLLPLLLFGSKPKAFGTAGHLVSLPGSPTSFQMELLGGEGLLPQSSGLQPGESRFPGDP